MMKGTWTAKEDKKLITYVTRYGCFNWRQLPRFAGLKRCGKSCRLRWMNYLRPNIKRGNYTKEEEETIIRMHKSLGNRWSAIAAQLPGRTDIEIKNHWHANLKKRVEQESGSVKREGEPISDVLISQTNTTRNKESEANFVRNPVLSNSGNPHHQIVESLMLPTDHQPSSSDFSSATSDTTAMASIDDLLSNDSFGVLDACEVPMSRDFWTDPFLGEDYYPTNEFREPLVDLDSPYLDGDMLFPYEHYHNGSLN